MNCYGFTVILTLKVGKFRTKGFSLSPLSKFVRDRDTIDIGPKGGISLPQT
jgi:hypothetical protein